MVFMKLFLLSLGKLLLLFLSHVHAWFAEYRGHQYFVNRLGLSPCSFISLDPSSIGSVSVPVVWRVRMFSMVLVVFVSRELAMML